MKTHNYSGCFLECCKVIVSRNLSFLHKGLLLLIFCFLITYNGVAQDSFTEVKDGIPFSFDEIPVLVIVEGYSNFYLDAIYANNDRLYVNIEELFRILQIQCSVTQNGELISGFIENENHLYSVDYNSGLIKSGTITLNAKDGMVKDNGPLYLESSLFSEAFRITLTFNFRALTVILKSDFELPVVRQQRIDQMRSNLSKIKGEEIADTVLKREYHMFRFGMVDWSVASYQTWKGTTDNRFGLGVGAELFKGEADISVNYYDQYKFDNRQLNYIWRWVDNDKKGIKQAQVGKISTQTISFINSPLIGAVVRNSPTTVRKATGYYTITEVTEPNWTVELYINNVMVDYTKADASGLIVFKVPMVYGYTTLKLMFYGPMGEERIEERSMNVPYTVMPAGEFEYGVAAGFLQDSLLSRFGRGEVNYGVNRILTISGGVEYLSSIKNGALIPFIKATIQPISTLIITSEYAYGVKTRGLLDLYFSRNALLELDYTKFVEGQLATRFNALEERKIKLSIPFRIKKLNGFSKFEYNQFVYRTFDFNQSNIIVSAYYSKFSANSSTQLNWISRKPMSVISELSLSYRPGMGFTVRPSVRYNVSEKEIMSYKVALEKSIPRGYFILTGEKNYLYDDNFINFTFRYDLTFARTSTSVSRSKGVIYTSQSAQGSLAFGSGNKKVLPGNNPAVGKGGIALYPFLDLNNNGIFDSGEHMVRLNTVKVQGSKALFSEKDSIVRIPDLIPFTSYQVEFSDNDLENISWRFSKRVYKILVDPNQFKRVDVPVISVGEVSGTAYMNRDNQLRGIGRILVKFYKENTTRPVAEVLSESDGYIYYLGLAPGEYYAVIDSGQMAELGYISDPGQINFKIKPSFDGDIVDGVDFVLNDMKTKIITRIDNREIISTNLHETDRDSIEVFVGRVTPVQKNHSVLVWGVLCEPIGSYYVQCGAFRNKSYALRMGLLIKEKTGLPVGVALHNGFYKVRVECMTSRSEIVEVMNELADKKVTTEMFIVIRK